MKQKSFFFIDVKVYNYKKHNKFRKIPDYDIAIIDTESIYERNFVPVCLTDDVVSLLGAWGSILTWAPKGSEEYGDLLGTELRVVKKESCRNSGFETPRDSFCVGENDGQSWLCHGDSGGGFMTRKNKRWFLRGVVSTGLADNNGLCDAQDTVIFTDVTRLLSFVVSNSDESSNIGFEVRR